MRLERFERFTAITSRAILLWIGLHSAISASLAGSCQDSPAIDLAKEEPLLSMKPFFQSGNPLTGEPGRPAGALDTGLCYAVTASQVYDFIRIRNGSNTSPISMASSEGEQTSPLFAAALYPSIVAERVLAVPSAAQELSEYCKSELRKLAANPAHPIPTCLRVKAPTEMLGTGGDACTALNGLFRRGSCRISDVWLDGAGKAYELQNAFLLSEVLPEAGRSVDQLMGPEASCDPSDQVGEASYSSPEIRNSILAGCSRSDRTTGISRPHCEHNRLSSIDSAWALIHRQLEAGYPMQLGVCLNLFKQKKADPGAAILQDGLIVPGPNCMVHSLLVVGRRWNKDSLKCEYKLRDSYPRGQDPVHPTDLWISAELLGGNLLTASPISGLY